MRGSPNPTRHCNRRPPSQLTHRPGELVVSLGTSATLFGVAGHPILDPTGAVCAFCDATGAWLPLICTLNCTLSAEEVCTAFGLGHEEATRLAEAEPAGASGVSFLPYFVGERTPNWPDSYAAILGLRPGVCACLCAAVVCSRRVHPPASCKSLRHVCVGTRRLPAAWRAVQGRAGGRHAQLSSSARHSR